MIPPKESSPKQTGSSVRSSLDGHQSASAPISLGIWMVGRALHRTNRCEISLTRPVDSGNSRRWDYVLKRSTTQDDAVLLQINQSIAVAADVSHPNLVPILDGNVTHESAYLVMPYLAGDTMQRHLDSGTPRPLPVALWLVRQIAQALGALHHAGWSHGDVKPSNVVIGTNGHATLIDMGFASHESNKTFAEFCGTPDYAAPELIAGPGQQAAPSDVYALGKILWQWLVASHVEDQTVLSPVTALVEAMIHPSASKRPDAQTVARALLRLEIDTLGHHIGPKHRAA